VEHEQFMCVLVAQGSKVQEVEPVVRVHGGHVVAQVAMYSSSYIRMKNRVKLPSSQSKSCVYCCELEYQ
jgi:hypothetical protein